MIYTTLPYDLDQMPAIQQNGATVDMNASDFSKYTAEDSEKTAIIYLRNTKFSNVTLDFSKCSAEKKLKYLRLFFDLNLTFNNISFSNTVEQLCLYILDKNRCDYSKSFLSQDELQLFCSQNKQMLIRFLSFVKSLPLFLLSQLKSVRLDSNICIKNDSVEFNNVINSIINDIDFVQIILLLQNNDEYHISFYPNVFVIENQALRTALATSVFGFLAYAALMTNETK